MVSGSSGPAKRVRTASTRTASASGVRLQLLTDPWSVWCWGFEPVRRAVEIRYPSISFEPLLGGMFPRMPDPESMGFDVGRFFTIVQRTTGMPMEAHRAVRDDPAESTYPACIFVHAMRILDPTKERPYLRALREALYLDGLNISRPEVGARVAGRVGVPKEDFTRVLDSGAAEASFQKRLSELHARQLHAYPTFLLTHEDRTARVEGFHSLPAILGLAENLSGRRQRLAPDVGLDAVVPAGERVATREVAETMGISIERAHDALTAAEKDGMLERKRHATGDVWMRVRDAGGQPIVRVW